jgi:diguanylate cyclase (GGDEF)-like protein/PAS domain S-box-containing protein
MHIGRKKEMKAVFTVLCCISACIVVSLFLHFSDLTGTADIAEAKSSALQYMIDFAVLGLTGYLLFSYRRFKGIRRREEDMKMTVEQMNPYAVLVVDSGGTIIAGTSALTNILEYEIPEVTGRKADVLFPGKGSEADVQKILETAAQHGHCIAEVTGVSKSGEIVSVEMIAGTLKSSKDIVLLLRDVTGRKRDKEALLIMKKAVENMQIGVTITNTEGTIIFTNSADAVMHGYRIRDLLGRDVRMFGLPSSFNPMTIDELRRLKRFRRETVNVRSDGSTFPVQLMSDIVTNREGKVIGVITTCEDITERKTNEETIRQIAYYDTLTGLPNRTLFNDLLKQELAKSRRSKKSFAVLFLDLDRFKNINDTLGHTVGDQLLQTVAKRITHVVRESDSVSRLGGDEFIILVPDIEQAEDAAVVAQKITEKLSGVFVLNKQEIYITASIGVSLYPLHGDDTDTLIKNADMAMYYAKEQGKNRYQFYAPSIHENTLRKLSIESSLRKALQQNELLLHYQPQIDLQSGDLVGVEALLRWKNPEYGLIGPKQFVSIAEETGLILPIGEWLLRTACLQNRIWKEQGLPEIKMSVNLSMNQLKQKDFVRTVESVLDETGVAPDSLEFELTENLLMQDKDISEALMHDLRSLGVHFSIDDFGTGYSSLNYLKVLPLDKLKVAQTFVRTIAIDPSDRAICRAIIMMAHTLNIRVIAEGVENNDQLEILRMHKCDEAQGFLFCRPLPADELASFMKAHQEELLLQS